MARDLTIKQEKYAQGLFMGLSQREAYKQAYNCENMTDKSVDELACKAANDIKIASRIAQLTDELKYRNMATKEKVLAEYAKIGFADIKDFLSFGTAKTVVDTDLKGNPVYGYKQIVDAKSSDEVDGTLINEISIGKDGTFRFKLHDKQQALDKIGKHLGMFVERLEHTGKDGGPIQTQDLSALSNEDLLALQEILSRARPEN